MTLLLASVAWIVDSADAAFSVLFAAGIVMVFFAISLLAGHFAGRQNPSGAIGVFALVYAVKIFGFAAVLLWIGTPEWVVPVWFGASGIVAVLGWQAVELWVFSRLRLQIFDDPAIDPGPEEATRD